MKIIICLLFCTAFYFSAHSQILTKFDTIRLKEKIDYKLAEPAVLEASEMILSNPAYPSLQTWQATVAFIFRWINGTPDYKLELNEFMGSILKDKVALPIYLTSFAKSAINSNGGASTREIEDAALKLMVDYLKDDQHKVKLGKKMKQFIKDYEENQANGK